jgi:hypothetical protein
VPKYIETVEPGDEGRAATMATLLSVAPVVVEAMSELARLSVNIADVETTSQGATPRYVAAIEYWFEGEEKPAGDSFARAWAQAGCPHLRRWVYRVSERVQLEVTSPIGPGKRPGVKALYVVRRPDGVSNEQATQGWREHAGTARAHHAGMTRYVQNGVVETLTSNAPVVHGIAELRFPSVRDLEKRMYDSEAGRKAIQQEASKLVGEVVPLFTTEYVFQGHGR